VLIMADDIILGIVERRPLDNLCKSVKDQKMAQIHGKVKPQTEDQNRGRNKAEKPAAGTSKK